ncbi:MAG: 4Fe-4S dicluster domain-containing protein [bacterium]
MKAILTDVTKCTGCDKCKEACHEFYNKGKVSVPSVDATDDLSEANWTTVLEPEKGVFVRRQCLHCVDPTCVSVCPVGAFRKDEAGPVIYDANKCIGCRYCMYACPFSIPRYEWGAVFPLVRKCLMCYELLDKGEIPKCVEVCPEQATIFGDRDELFAEARRRIEASPNRYINHIYGEKEAGGTCVLYISNIKLDDVLGFRERVGVDPLSTWTWDWMVKVPTIGLGAGVAMTGVWWTIRRRMQLEKENGS